MSTTELKSLIDKLNPICHRSLEKAAGLCASRTHFNVEIEHWIYQLLDIKDNDIYLILKQFSIDIDQLRNDVLNAINQLRTGNAKTPSIAPEIIEWIESAWLHASLNQKCVQIRSEFLLSALLTDQQMARVARGISDQFSKISIDSLQQNADSWTNQSIETRQQNTDKTINHSSSTNALNQYTINLSQQAKQQQLDPVLGRDNEIRQMIDILLRKRQNNPILTGEAGVGKTAIVEGLALKIEQGEVPDSLRSVSVRTLDLTLLKAGAGIKGEFENRLNQVIEEVKSSPQPIILFIDEAHTMIGAGGEAGQGDAANLLKPALARGELRTIAATTWAEYKKYFEKDAALTRRFQVVKVNEPTEQQAITMMRGIANHLQDHHKVTILDEAIIASVKLAHRYIAGRQLPDKSLCLLDTASAKVVMSQTSVPAAIAALEFEQQTIGAETIRLQQEISTGVSVKTHQLRLEQLGEQNKTLQHSLNQFHQQWQSEKQLIKTIHDIRTQLYHDSEPGKSSEKERIGLRNQLQQQLEALHDIQGTTPLLHHCVDASLIAQVISEWTGIPVGRMLSNEVKSILQMADQLKLRVIGQDLALDEIVKRIHISRAKLADPNKPIGVFLLAGSSGTGKTETALALAEKLYGSEKNITTINMSEFKEAHKVSMLLGSPPGYVGYGEGGVLTEAIRRRPFGLVLLDEMEKAHPSVQDIFYQMFDKGILMDGEGQVIDCKNTLIIMTTNIGSECLLDHFAEADIPKTNFDTLVATIRPSLLKVFKPAFLGRITVVPYLPLQEDVLKSIINLQLQRLALRIHDNYQAQFSYDDKVVSFILNRCHEMDTGARRIEQIIQGVLLPELSNQCLIKIANEEPIESIKIRADNAGFSYDIPKPV